MARAKGKDEAKKTPTRKKSREAARNAIWNHALLAIVTGAVGVVAMVGLVWWQLVIATNETYVSQQMNLLNQAVVPMKLRSSLRSVGCGASTTALIADCRGATPCFVRR